MPAPSAALDGTFLSARPRRRPSFEFGFAFLLVVSLCVLSMGHTVRAQEIDANDVVKMRTDIVTVPVVAVDSHGRRVMGLQPGNFVVTIEGRPQPVAFFVTGASRVAVVFLLDASGSARSYMSEQRNAALSLLSRFGAESEVAVVRFSDITTVTAPFSVDIRKASGGFDFPASAEQHTAIFDGAMAALQLLSRRQHDPTERRIVILTSDGLDTASKVKAAEVIARARKDNVTFYVIHFPLYSPHEGRLRPRPAAPGFRQLADKTGGHYFLTADAASTLAGRSQIDLSGIFKAIAEDLAGQYLLGFYPDAASHDGRTHKIDVRLEKVARDVHLRTLRDELRLAF